IGLGSIAPDTDALYPARHQIVNEGVLEVVRVVCNEGSLRREGQKTPILAERRSRQKIGNEGDRADSRPARSVVKEDLLDPRREVTTRECNEVPTRTQRGEVVEYLERRSLVQADHLLDARAAIAHINPSKPKAQ